MGFTKEVTEFPSIVHQIIYCSARELTPLEHSLLGCEDVSLKVSCESFHHFIGDMLSDMYEFPEEYGFPVLELEKFLDGNKLNGMKQRYPSKTKDVLSRTRNVVDRYMATLCKMGFLGTAYEEHLELPEEVFPIIEKTVNTPISPISFGKRLQALSRVGLIHTNTGFISTKYPAMFPAMCALAAKAKGTSSGFTFYNFVKLDFRNIGKNYKPTYEDYFHPLIEERRKKAYQLHQIAIENRCRPTINTFLKVDYKYGGVQVMCMDSSKGNLDIRIVETYSWNDASLINSRLLSEAEQFQKQALRHLWRCTACSTSHLGQFVEVLGHRNRVCGGGQIGFQWYNPSEEDMAIIRRFIELRCEIIDQLKKEGKK